MTKWGEKPYHSLDYMLRERFGEKVYKVTLNGGMSCPNRDGKIGTRGCIFCSAGGSGDFAADAALSITDQIESQISILSQKRRFINILPISRRTQIPTHLWNIWRKFLQKQSLIQR